jgi:hypothetical protein
VIFVAEDSLKPEESSEADEVPEIKLRRRNLKGRAKLCPNCLSRLRIANNLAGWMTPEEYYCEKCGYRGYVSLEHAKKN